MTSPSAAEWPWNQAAHCYELAGRLEDAGRCYANAGQFPQAARVFRAAGNLRATAQMESHAGRHLVAAWIFVHELGDAEAARQALPPIDETAGNDLLRRLVEMRCALAEGAPADTVLPVLAAVQDHLGAPGDLVWTSTFEEWGVAVAEAANRFDQVALTYAAAVRGGDDAAAERWRRWAQDRFGQRIVIPQATPAATRGTA
ncbi:hypothetical protein ACIA5D_23560 [Actinoplanes sp. NPDC051513]|uniref:hypothetical protein n=1 Tax=Actinoplanes sp. NPDC051513 TaxID=3363908 RepID=UPI0037AD4774